MTIGFQAPQAAPTPDPAPAPAADPAPESAGRRQVYEFASPAPMLVFAVDGGVWKVDNAEPAVLDHLTPRQLIILSSLARFVADAADATRTERQRRG